MTYIKQLDSLRAIAIFFVLCNHWLPKGNLLYEVSEVIAAPNIFFTISGFLITMILLKDREKAELEGISKTTVFLDFTIKRSLRILPAYYLTIFITYVLKPDAVTDYSSYLNFTANFEIYNNQSWGNLAHLWSMSVEQQFYLIWPLLLLSVPKRFLLHTIISFILIGIFSQNIVAENEFLGVLPQTCFDALGIGSLLSWVVLHRNSLLVRYYKVLRLLGITSVALVISQGIWGDFQWFIHGRTLMAVVVAWLIAHFLLGRSEGKSSFSLIFNNKALFLIGKISYGIYLYHLTLFYHIHTVLKVFNEFIPLPQSIVETSYFYIFESLIVLFALALLSWRFYELPLSNMKRYLKVDKLFTVFRSIQFRGTTVLPSTSA